MPSRSDAPSPGSPEAVEAGCTCPILDNAHGRGLGNGLFWLDGDCPLHSPFPLPDSAYGPDSVALPDE